MKLIAIRTIKGCPEEHLKALQPDKLYYFYTNYKIKGNKIEELSNTERLFSSEKRKSAINVSVVVGKNGSGKSSLVELLIKIINNFSVRQGQATVDLEYVPGVMAELFFQTETYYKIKVNKASVKAYQYNGKTKIVDREIKLAALQKDLFYTIIANYSLYAYNSLLEGTWMNGLFAKNDGYKTPLVLNPFRDKGNININIENHLTNTRLISNFLIAVDGKYPFQELTPIFSAKYLQLTVRESKVEKVLYESIDEEKNNVEVRLKDLKQINYESLLLRLNSIIPFSYTRINKKEYKLALEYLVYKMISIALKYYNEDKLFFDKTNGEFVEKNIEEFFLRLKGDFSHITLKLRQTINFLRLKKIPLKKHQLNLDKYAKSIGTIGRIRRRWNIFESAELSPPPLFDIEILMKTKGRKAVSFKTLSSGEKQLIYSESSVLYHLANLNSIHRSSGKRITYRWVNIVLEEVELYAHPEMQRLFLDHLLTAIERLKLRMYGINICLITHSPFVLSDVPRSNLLFLPDPANKQQQIEDDVQTFGANIYDLLAQTFFLENGAIGEYARRRIQEVIDILEDAAQRKEKEPSYRLHNVKEIIDIIGEPLIKQKLLEEYEQLKLESKS